MTTLNMRDGGEKKKKKSVKKRMNNEDKIIQSTYCSVAKNTEKRSKGREHREEREEATTL